MTLYFTSYYKNDFVGLIWTEYDELSHPCRARARTSSFAGVVWTFDLILSSNMPTIKSIDKSITMTIECSNGPFFIPLYQFLENQDDELGRTGRVIIDFDNLTEGDGFDGAIVTPINVSRILIGAITDEYNEGETERLDTPLECSLTINTISVTGGRANIFVNNESVDGHDMGIATSYDDQHNISPERILDEAHALGYRGFLNHYVGMSRYPRKYPYPAGGITALKADLTLGNTVNKPTTQWHIDFATRAASLGYDVMYGISFEMFSPFAEQSFCQVEYDGTLGETGYTPTSYFLSPGNDNAMQYLQNVFIDFAAIMQSAGAQIRLQIGEPWWWWNTTNRKPCFYDFPNKVKFNQWSAAKGHDNGNGYFAPEFTSVDDPRDDPVALAFKEYLQEQLGKSTTGIRTAVKSAYPTAKVSLLFFLPTILSPYAGMMSFVNYPIDYYKKPNFDSFVWEAYDTHWHGGINQILVWAQQINDDLGYTGNDIEYLAGFVPNQELADAFNYDVLAPDYAAELWGRILGVCRRLRADFGNTKQAIWALPQVQQSALILHPQSKYFEMTGREFHPEIDNERPVRFFKPRG
jgi:hypothetical protein